MTEPVVARAPATTANLGPGFDCAGAALALWNELHVLPADGGPLVEIEGVGADEIPHDESHLALRAFALRAPLDGLRFRFVNRIPLERGLGSSAATVAVGLAAGARIAGFENDEESHLELAMTLEEHADNIAPALIGGVCLTWRQDGRQVARRIADDLPLDPVAVVPDTRVSTSASRSRLPDSLRHAEAAAASAQAALLGAAIASGDADLLAAAFHDLLHEPYRLDDAPLLKALGADLPAGAAGVTLSGSGPSVIVWAEKGRGEDVAAILRGRAAGAQVLPLAVAGEGTHSRRTIGAAS